MVPWLGLPVLFVRRHRGRDDEQAVEAELVPRGARDCEVCVVDGIERTPEKRNVQAVMVTRGAIASGMSTPFEDGPAELSDIAARAVDIAVHYRAELPDLPVMPVTTAADVRNRLREPLPHDPVSAEDALAIVRDIVYPFSRHNGHPRFFGYVASPGTAAAAAGEFLAAALNANVTSWRSAPAAAEMEHLVIDWLKQMIGYREAAVGLLVSGGSVANLCGLAAARAAADPEFERRGPSETRRLRVYVSDEAHFSIGKAARLLGIGSDNVQCIPTDAHFRMDVEELRRIIVVDRANGYTPMCIVGSAGTVNTGAVDPLNALAEVAREHGTWLHVDGAYGALAALAPSARHLFAGIEHAHSVSLDPHKWLYGAVGCGCVLYRDAAAARAAFAHDADYTRPVGLERDEAFAFWDYGIELSRPFRALPVWLQIKLWGIRKLAAAIESNMECARHFGALVEAAEDFELLTPVGLSIFCFRWRPAGYAGDLDVLNEKVLIELQRAGGSYLSNTRIGGRFALRGCVLNHRTRLQDMERLLEDVRSAGQAVLGGQIPEH
jgi:aromatic-L-amino-acid/L-tryptophan decarboxylase